MVDTSWPAARRRRAPDRRLCLGHVGEGVEGVPPHGVLVGHLGDVGVGHVVGHEHGVQLLGGGGPHGVAVRVVGLPRHVVDADPVAQLHPHRVADEAGQEVLAEHLARAVGRRSPAGSRRGASRRSGRPGRGSTGSIPCRPRTGPPAASGKFFSTRDHSRSAAADWMFMGCRVIITSGGESTAGIDEPARRAEVDGEHGAGVAARPPHRVPVLVVEARVAERGGVLGEAQRVAALGRRASDLGGGQIGVPDDGHGHGDEPARVGAAPLVDVPVVVGPHQGERQVRIVARRTPAR